MKSRVNFLSPLSDKKKGWISASFGRNKNNLSSPSIFMGFRKRGLFMPELEQNRSIAQGDFWQTCILLCSADRPSRDREDMTIRILCWQPVKPGLLTLRAGQADFQTLPRSWAAPREGTFFSFKEVKFVFISKQHSNSCDEAQQVSSVLILIGWLCSELNLQTM